MSDKMTKEQLLTHIDELERSMLGAARYLATTDYRLLDATLRHIHSNTLIQQIAYHALLVDQLQMRFPQHQPEEDVK
jgi:hypothetical protein